MARKPMNLEHLTEKFQPFTEEQQEWFENRALVTLFRGSLTSQLFLYLGTTEVLPYKKGYAVPWMYEHELLGMLVENQIYANHKQAKRNLPVLLKRDITFGDVSYIWNIIPESKIRGLTIPAKYKLERVVKETIPYQFD